MVDATHVRRGASRVGEGDAVVGVSLALAVALGEVGPDAVGLAGALGPPAQPASARASRAVVVVTARRRVVGRRGVANSTRRRYVTAPGTAECPSPPPRPGSTSGEHAAAAERQTACSLLSTGRRGGIRQNRPHADRRPAAARRPRRRHRSRRRLRTPPRRAAPGARPAGGDLRRWQRPAGRRRAQHPRRARDRGSRRRARRCRRGPPAARGAGRRPARARVRRHGRPRDAAADPAPRPAPRRRPPARHHRRRGRGRRRR